MLNLNLVRTASVLISVVFTVALAAPIFAMAARVVVV
jgi:hypothetical protein